MTKFKKQLTEQQQKDVANDYQSGMSLKEVHLKYRIPELQVRFYVISNGGRIRTSTDHKRKYTFNEHYFDEIDTKDKAYWLGFIYADGFILKNRIKNRGADSLGITLAETEPLEKFNKSIESTRPIYHFKQSGYCTNSDKYRLVFKSDHLVSMLEKWGCISRKTFDLIFPNFLTKELIPHFIRGYFDGDGSVFYHNTKVNNRIYQNLGITICGTQSFLNDFVKACNLSPDIVYKDFRKETDCWSIKLASNLRCLEMYHFMYKDAGDLCLSRKRDKFENFILERGSETLIDSRNRTINAPYLKECYVED